MSELIGSIAQLIFFAWPAWIVLAILVRMRPRIRWKTRLNRARQAALVLWLILLPIWLLTWLGPQPALSLLPAPWNNLLFMSGFSAMLILEVVPRLKLVDFKNWFGPTQQLHEIAAIEQLNALHPTQFEELVQQTYRLLGFSAQHVGHSGDHGVDLLVRTPAGERWVVQCKRWHDPVGEATIRELYGTLFHEKADRAVLVTSSDITPPAERWARGKPIDLVDGPALLALIASAQRMRKPSLAQKLTNWLHTHIPMRSNTPLCPSCHVPMVAHPHRSYDQQQRKTYRCRNYPNCRVVVVLKP